MDIGGAGGMVLSAGWGVGGDGDDGGDGGGGDGEGDGKGSGEGDDEGVPVDAATGGVGGVWRLDGEGGENNGGEATPDRGERRSLSSSPSGPRSNSTLLRRLLILLGGGVVASGDEGEGTGCALLGGVDDTAWTGVVVLFPAKAAEVIAAVAVEGKRTVLALVEVAARPRRRRRWRFLAVAAIADVVGRLQVMVATWKPAAWLNTTRAFGPFTRQRSYNAEKSALETAGCDVGRAGVSTLAHSFPLTTSAHVGETREVWGQGRAGECWLPACLAHAPSTPEGEGEVGWRAWRGDRQTAEPLRPPPLVGEGGQVAGRAPGCRRRAPSRTRVSSVLDKG